MGGSSTGVHSRWMDICSAIGRVNQPPEPETFVVQT